MPSQKQQKARALFKKRLKKVQALMKKGKTRKQAWAEVKKKK